MDGIWKGYLFVRNGISKGKVNLCWVAPPPPPPPQTPGGNFGSCTTCTDIKYAALSSMNHVLSNKKLAGSTSKRTLNIDHCLMNIKLLHFVFFVLVELLSYCFAKCSFNAAYQFQIKPPIGGHAAKCNPRWCITSLSTILNWRRTFSMSGWTWWAQTMVINYVYLTRFCNSHIISS